jgi:O-antigen ligase
MAHHAYRSFVGGNGASTDLNSRLFSLSNDGRLPAWRVAWDAFESHPVGGIGAGGFENAWNQHRTTVSKIRDAHNFYVETLAEDGAVGFVLLIGTLLIPFGAIRRARAHPLAAGALAAYVAYLVHVIADWDWELSGVTLVALFCGGSVLVLARSGGERPAPRKPLLALAIAVGAVALSGLAANLALDASTSAVRVGDTSRAASDARLAHWLMPWAAAPLQALGAAQPGHAVANYRAAVAKSPGDYRLWIDLAKAETGTARWRDLATALRLNPRDQDEIRLIAQQLLGSPTEGAQE